MNLGRATFACALPMEARLARRYGNVEVVGMGCKRGIPRHEVIAFGFVGSLRKDWPPGTVVTVDGIANENGDVRPVEPLAIPGAKRGVVFGVDEAARDSSTLLKLREKTKADLVHMEVHRYPRLRGAVFAITDYPDRPLGHLASAIDDDEAYIWKNIAAAFLKTPWHSACVSANSLYAKRALRRLPLQMHH